MGFRFPSPLPATLPQAHSHAHEITQVSKDPLNNLLPFPQKKLVSYLWNETWTEGIGMKCPRWTSCESLGCFIGGYSWIRPGGVGGVAGGPADSWRCLVAGTVAGQQGLIISGNGGWQSTWHYLIYRRLYFLASVLRNNKCWPTF